MALQPGYAAAAEESDSLAWRELKVTQDQVNGAALQG